MRTIFVTAAALAASLSAPLAQAHQAAGLPPAHLHGWDLLGLVAVVIAGAAWLVRGRRG